MIITNYMLKPSKTWWNYLDIILAMVGGGLILGIIWQVAVWLEKLIKL